jgi:hypothetical protein
MQMRLHFAIRLNGDAPLAFAERVAIFADDHLLRAFQHIRIEPHRDSEAAAGELRAVLQFDERTAIQARL